jgi:hypothetical protein
MPSTSPLNTQIFKAAAAAGKADAISNDTEKPMTAVVTLSSISGEVK